MSNFNNISFIISEMFYMVVNPIPIIRDLSVDPIEPLPAAPDAPADDPRQIYLVTGRLQTHERTPTISLTGILALHPSSTQLVICPAVTYCSSAGLKAGKRNVYFLKDVRQIKTSFLKNTPPCYCQGVVYFQAWRNNNEFIRQSFYEQSYP